MKHRIAIVVPTKDRPQDMRTMLTSMARQTRLPDQIVVVDGSEIEIRSVVDEFARLPIEYVRCIPPSLSRQRNAGMERLRADITLAGYLDDDIELEPDAIEQMLKFWESATPDVGGAVFSITNTPPVRGRLIKSWLGLDSAVPGRVLPSGCTSVLGYQAKDIDTDWLCGGATIWRREVIQTYPYDEWFKGTGYLEDVDYSFNVHGRYRLVLVAAARLAHYSRPVRADKHFLLGKWQIINRMYLVHKYRARGLSVPRAWFASFALVAWHLAQALLRFDVHSWNRARGNIVGIYAELLGRRDQIHDFLK